MLDRKKRKVRVIRRIEELKLLELCKKAGLKDYEILAVVSVRAYQSMRCFRFRASRVHVTGILSHERCRDGRSLIRFIESEWLWAVA